MINRQHWCEQSRRVAVLADIGCLNVCRVLADGVCTVVTAYTVSGDVTVIEIGCGNPGGSDVAVITGVPRRNVRRMFADGYDSIVT